jgi:hypothetical protein
MGSRRSRHSTRASTAQSAPPSNANESGDAGGHLPHTGGSPEALLTDIPLQIKRVIERERRRLQQASAVLSCLKIAALYQEWHEEIDAGDVAMVVQSLIAKAINHLDLIRLARSATEIEEHGMTEGTRTEDD